MRFQILLALAVPAIVSAAPAPTFDPITHLECLAVDLVLDVLQAYTSATPFCSSFLEIPTASSTTTVVAQTATTTVVTSTTGTDTVTAAAVTSVVTQDATVTSCIPTAAKLKRHQPQPSASSTAKVTSSSTSKVSTATSSSAIIAATGVPSCLQAYQAAQISTACSCLSVVQTTATIFTSTTATSVITSVVNVAATTTYTPTVVSTYTTTSTSDVCPTPTSCDNQGLQFAVQVNPYYNSDAPTYSAFDPTYFKTESPEYTGVTDTIGGFSYAYDGGAYSVYGSPDVGPDYITVNHRGYLFAEVSGTYTFTLSGADDISFLWLGEYAYSGYTRDNADAINGVRGPDGVYTVDLVEGEYYALRIMFGNAQGDSAFYASVTAPNGAVILDSDSAASPYLVQYSCDGTTAPAYADFGSET